MIADCKNHKELRFQRWMIMSYTDFVMMIKNDDNEQKEQTT